jgi:hypothetical protein
MSTKRNLSLASLIILMLCVMLHFARAQQPSAWWMHAVDGACGAANGVAVSAAPTADLCTSGTASAVTESGPWTWRCNGSQGGSSASCSAPVESAGGATTTAGVPLPTGWALRQFDTFGTDGNVTNYTQLHAEYCESLFFNVDSSGCLVRLPNVVINNEQETYEHFETSVVFLTDHLEIQGRGQPDGTIRSAEMVAKYTPLSFCIEARYQIPATPGSWPSFWIGSSAGVTNTQSEIDVEQPVSASGSDQTVNEVSLNNHPTQGTLTVANPDFSIQGMKLYSTTDFSAAPHYYTICYDDLNSTITKWIDGGLIYTATNWKWTSTPPTTIMNLAVGGSFPGNLSNPSAYIGNLDVYSIAYYAP